MSWRHGLNILSVRKNGDALIGTGSPGEPFAENLYDIGTPPMHGMSARHPISERVSSVSVGDELDVVCDGRVWWISDGDGVLGAARWRPGDNGKTHAVTGVIIRLPDRGTLHVTNVLCSDGGVVKDVGGYVVPR